MSERYRLMTIGPSHYCEKARWALDFFNVDYVEEKHLPADLTFASLAAPVLLPPAYGALLPGEDELPAEVAELVEEFRSTAAGAFALRMYEKCR